MTLESATRDSVDPAAAKPVRAGIVGLGVGEAHLRSYQAIPGVEVAAICDIDPDRLGEIGARYDVAARHGDWRAVTEHADVDVVSICSYDDSHAAQVISALEHGKHVMVEKPVVLRRSEAEAVLRALEDSGRLLTSNLILRESPRFKEVKRMIAAGDFGEVFHIEGDYLHQILWKITEGWRGKMDFYCTFYGGGIHLIDLMRWLMGQEIEKVSAMGTDIPTRDSSYKYPDTITALMKFTGGATGKCTSTLAPQRTKFHALNVYGTKLTFANDMPDAKLFSGDDPADERAMTTPYPGMEKGDMLPEFIAAIRSGGRPAVDATDIFRVIDVCFAVWEAVQTGGTVEVDYLI
jgi:predicted dehydrogenase